MGPYGIGNMADPDGVQVFVWTLTLNEQLVVHVVLVGSHKYVNVSNHLERKRKLMQFFLELSTDKSKSRAVQHSGSSLSTSKFSAYGFC